MTTALLEPKNTPLALSIQELLPIALPKDPLHLLRTQARKRFEEIGLPSRKDEAFQYFPLRTFYQDRLMIGGSSSVIDEDIIEKQLAPECRGSCLVFVDGHFHQELSIIDALDPKIGVLSLDEAMKTFGHYLNTRLMKQIKEEKDPFALLNLAVHPNGAFLYIPPKLVLEQPIQILHIVSQTGALIAPRLHVFVGAHAQVKLYATTCGCHFQEGLDLEFTDIALEEGARCELVATACVKSRGWSMEYLRTTQKRDSFLSVSQITKSTVGFRKDIKIDLLGDNASAEMNGLVLLFDQEQASTRIVVNHEAPHTHSSQHFKGVLTGSSQSSFEGKIVVQKPAQKTEAYQLCNHLVLGERAIANSKPNLEIMADDVKASHGATVTQLKEHELLYLKSRGIGTKEAKNLLIEGFCQEIASKIFLASLIEEISHFVRSYSQD